MHGKGVFSWPDGTRYTGEYVKGKKQGWGVFLWANGKEFEGTWKNGKQEGYGYMRIHSKEEFKKGLWKGGKHIKWVQQEESTRDS